jgi:hypothetical protein
VNREDAAAPLFLLLGPTASGKSGFALRLAQRLPIEIVSVDSAQVYRGMDIGTAKPDAAERAAVTHHLIDIVDPVEHYSAARFVDDALAAIAGIRARGRLPLLVGAPLALAWPRLGVLGRGFVWTNLASMLAVLGWLYRASPLRVCNAYRISEQQQTGEWLVFLAIVTFVGWLATLFVTRPAHDATR